MSDNFSNFNDFLDMKSPEMYQMEQNNDVQYDFLQMNRPNYVPNNDYLMRMDNQQQVHPLSANPTEQSANYESLSTKSGYSTNYSIKHSPDYQVDEESSGNSDRTMQKWSQNPPIQKKTINKDYQPIYDGKKCYTYEEDPIEYKKARKRIQNRESASRVRSRKKNYVEVVEHDVNALKKENSELQLKNAALTAENALLKQQIGFLERIVMNNNSQNASMEMVSESNNNNSNNRHILPLQKSDGYVVTGNNSNEDNSNDSIQGIGGFMRMSPNHPFKKHVSMLGVVTLLLCVAGFVTGDARPEGEVGGSLQDFSNSLSMRLLDIKDGGPKTETNDTLTLYSRLMEQSIHNFIQTQEKSLIGQIIKISILLSYFCYFGYVCWVAKRTVFRGKIKLI